MKIKTAKRGIEAELEINRLPISLPDIHGQIGCRGLAVIEGKRYFITRTASFGDDQWSIVREEKITDRTQERECNIHTKKIRENMPRFFNEARALFEYQELNAKIF